MLSQGACASRIGPGEIAGACQAHLGDQHPLFIPERFEEREGFLSLRDRAGIRPLVGGYLCKANECVGTAMLVSHLAEEYQRLLQLARAFA